MSKVKIELKQHANGFTKVSVDGKDCGSLEDLGDTETSIDEVFRRVVDALELDNIEVVRK